MQYYICNESKIQSPGTLIFRPLLINCSNCPCPVLEILNLKSTFWFLATCYPTNKCALSLKQFKKMSLSYINLTKGLNACWWYWCAFEDKKYTVCIFQMAHEVKKSENFHSIIWLSLYKWSSIVLKCESFVLNGCVTPKQTCLLCVSYIVISLDIFCNL